MAHPKLRWAHISPTPHAHGPTKPIKPQNRTDFNTYVLLFLLPFILSFVSRVIFFFFFGFFLVALLFIIQSLSSDFYYCGLIPAFASINLEFLKKTLLLFCLDSLVCGSDYL